MDVLLDPVVVEAFVNAFLLILKIAGMSAVFSFVLGVILAAFRVSPVPVLRAIGTGWVNLFRNTPLTVIITFCYFGLYSALKVQFSDDLKINNYWLAVVGLSVYTAAFVCEAIRAGINTVPVGQAEAARALGLTFSQNLRLVVMPQALRSVIAPLGSVFIAMFKNATVAGVIGNQEAAVTMKALIEEYSSVTVPIFLAFALTFVVILVPVGYAFSFLSNKLAVKR